MATPEYVRLGRPLGSELEQQHNLGVQTHENRYYQRINPRRTRHRTSFKIRLRPCVVARRRVHLRVRGLAEYNVPLLTSSVHPMMTNKNYDDPNVQAWSDKIDSLSAFVFVTPEYNHGVPGAFKNAVDVLGAEWVGKPVAF